MLLLLPQWPFVSLFHGQVHAGLQFRMMIRHWSQGTGVSGCMGDFAGKVWVGCQPCLEMMLGQGPVQAPGVSTLVVWCLQGVPQAVCHSLMPWQLGQHPWRWASGLICPCCA